MRLYDRRMLPLPSDRHGSRSKAPQWVSCYIPAYLKVRSVLLHCCGQSGSCLHTRTGGQYLSISRSLNPLVWTTETIVLYLSIRANHNWGIKKSQATLPLAIPVNNCTCSSCCGLLQSDLWDSRPSTALHMAGRQSYQLTSVGFARGGSEVVGSYSGHCIYSFDAVEHAHDVESLLHIPESVLRYAQLDTAM